MGNKSNNTRDYKKEKERAIKNRIERIQSQPTDINLSTKKGLLLPYANTKLTPTEREIANYLAIDHYTTKQIRIIRGVTRQAVSKIIKNW